MNRRRFLPTLLSAAALALLGTPSAQAQTAQGGWTSKPVRIVAAGPAGATADIVARVLADALAKQTGQTVIVEPKPGAGGMIAVNELNQAPRDGTTLLKRAEAAIRVADERVLTGLGDDRRHELKQLLGEVGIPWPTGSDDTANCRRD